MVTAAAGIRAAPVSDAAGAERPSTARPPANAPAAIARLNMATISDEAASAARGAARIIQLCRLTEPETAARSAGGRASPTARTVVPIPLGRGAFPSPALNQRHPEA
ncbi:hypothetical protein AMK15_32185 [Streptomyces sp. MJM1172]|nr:hypothetical protein AMK15_32185 [Streptomyces sp. MJM1172]